MTGVIDRPLSGRCNCGGVAFVATGVAAETGCCHCRECRRASGHFWPGVTAPLAGFRFLADATLRWWRASARAERGFCAVCGGFLFWKPTGGETIEIALGAFDGPTGVRLRDHINTAEKGDYYALDDLPCWPGARPG